MIYFCMIGHYYIYLGWIHDLTNVLDELILERSPYRIYEYCLFIRNEV